MIALVSLGMSMSVVETTIYGTITEGATGEPLIGANVIVKGTTIGTVTDIDGNYRLIVTKLPVELEVNYTGFTNKIIEVELSGENKVEVNVKLEEAMTLEEVVVVGYGTKKRRSTTASRSVVKSTKAKVSRGKKTRKAKVTSSSSMMVVDGIAPKTMGTATTTGSYDDVSYFSSGAVATSTVTPAPMMAKDGFAVMEKPSIVYEAETYEEKISTSVLHFKTDASTMLLDGKFVSKNLIPLAEMNPLEVIALDLSLIHI